MNRLIPEEVWSWSEAAGLEEAAGGEVAEAEGGAALMDRLEATPVEFGHGMALWAGRSGSTSTSTSRWSIWWALHVEQLGTCAAEVDDQLRPPGLHAPRPSAADVAGRSEQLVRHALTANRAG